MTSWLPEVEGWVKLAGAAVAIVMAALVPVRSWIAEDRRYQAQTLEALGAATLRPSAASVAPAPQLLADSLALGAVAEALREVAAALVRLSDQGDERRKDRLGRALEALLADRRFAGDG